jgi:hypothetical protein
MAKKKKKEEKLKEKAGRKAGEGGAEDAPDEDGAPAEAVAAEQTQPAP